MTYDSNLVVYLAPATIVLYILYKHYWPVASLPPSPSSYPLLGNLLSFPFTDQPVAYKRIGDRLNSDIISFKVLGQVIVVLNSLEAATDLLIKRSSIYSDRPELTMLTDDLLLGWGRETAFLHYGERWKQQRKLTQAALHLTTGSSLVSRMVKHTRETMQRLLQNPEDIKSEIRWLSGANILASVYGYHPAYPFDNLVDIVEIAKDRFSEAAAVGNFDVNLVPWLKYVPKWLPGAGFKRKASAWRGDRDRMIEEPYLWTKSQIAAGCASPSITKDLISRLENAGIVGASAEEREDIVRWTAGSMYSAGAETSASAMMTLVLAMILHPQIQQQAQIELDSVLGEDRLPELSDREALGQISRIVKEVLRWHSIGPLAIPHVCIQDDVYRGYVIPKGALVVGNVWAISHDSAVYPEPEKFNPDRFLDPSLPDAPAFGFGRRICPGMEYSEASLFMVASTLLTVYNIVPTPGKPMPEAKFATNRLASHPLPFSCTLIPRSEKRKNLIERWVEV